MLIALRDKSKFNMFEAQNVKTNI